MKTFRTHIVKSYLEVKTLKDVRFFKGMVMTLDSYRRKGGYFGSTSNHYFGLFFEFQKETYIFKPNNEISRIASFRKKHVYKTWVNINYDSFNKIYL